jgi:hypothetical protein
MTRSQNINLKKFNSILISNFKIVDFFLNPIFVIPAVLEIIKHNDIYKKRANLKIIIPTT